jgi:NAD(P)-dependent dehydrogenase (short-subunit alcohol dehydrogenase family)
MPHPVFKPSNTALITGSASGIGLAIAKSCASLGLNLFLVDLNAELLKTTSNTLSSQYPDLSISYQSGSVASLEDWESIKEQAAEDFDGKIDLLVLNAGTSKPTGDWNVDNIRAIWETNVFGVVNGVSTMVPEMKKLETPGAIVITGSKQGITNPPGKCV